jgi:ABC-type sugar transport system ATPase subunit/Asp-tRNA(Asn)/Glu-tRNA(Gln) amidotransferase A subunit family amidase
VAKTNVPEYTWSYETENVLYGRTLNPFDPERTPGGSSGGEAALLGADASVFGIGTDGGGSIRVPSHYCGIAGLRPTAGLVAETGCWPSTRDTGYLDMATIGPMARHAEDLDLLLRVIAGPDGVDPFVHGMGMGDPRAVDVAPLRVGYYTYDGVWRVSDGVAAGVEAAARALSERGCAVEEATPPDVSRATSLFFELMAADGGARARADLAPAGGRHVEQMSRLLADLRPLALDATDFFSLLARLFAFRASVRAFVGCFDVVLAPPAAGPAPLHGCVPGTDEPLETYDAFNYTHVYSAAGLPVAVVRVGEEQGLPVGVQVVANAFREDVALAVAAALEESCGGFRPARPHGGRMSGAGPILQAEGMHKRYGGVHALRGARLSVFPGEVHALMGENGSGKTTLLKILSGQLQPDEGRITFAGRPTSFRAAIEALRKGISTVTQETTLAPDLSIAENVFLGHRMARRAGFIDWRRTRRRARDALARLALDLDPATPARRLRPDQQQMVEIARALSIDARVLILDEPTSSLTDDEVAALFAIVRRLSGEGVATIFVSHRINEVFAIADRITVLRDGRTVGGGLASELDRGRLIQLMVGHALDADEHQQQAQSDGDTVLRARGLSLPGLLQDVDLDVAPGEIVGLAGLVGAGRSELLESLFGLRRVDGDVFVRSRRVRYRSPRQAIRDGVAFVPADRKLQGLVLDMSVRENLMMASTSRYARLRHPSTARELSAVDEIVAGLRIRTHSWRASVSTLSGGNQQKIVLGKWLLTRPDVLMLDEPTRGVDVGAKAEIYRLLFEAAQHGIGILVSSSENPELLTLCDRIVVMFRGRVAATLTRENATEAMIAHLAAGHQ